MTRVSQATSRSRRVVNRTPWPAAAARASPRAGPQKLMELIPIVAVTTQPPGFFPRPHGPLPSGHVLRAPSTPGPVPIPHAHLCALSHGPAFSGTSLRDVEHSQLRLHCVWRVALFRRHHTTYSHRQRDRIGGFLASEAVFVRRHGRWIATSPPPTPGPMALPRCGPMKPCIAIPGERDDFEPRTASEPVSGCEATSKAVPATPSTPSEPEPSASPPPCRSR